MKIQEVLPVAVSIMVIIAIAIIERQSKVFAAITATMPINITVALWIVYSSAGGEKSTMSAFSQSLLIGLLPTLAFVFTAWLAARAGLKLGLILLSGYSVWGFGSLLLLWIRKLL